MTDIYGLSYWHSVEITGLAEGTTYHFRIRAVDTEENETLSEDLVFTTKTPAELNSIITAKRAELGLSGDMLYPQVYYLSPTGNDDNTGLSADSAWQNPSYAVYQLHAGDTLWVLQGTYFENTTSTMYFENMGIETHRVVIKSHPDNTEMPVWDGDGIYTAGLEIFYSYTPYQPGFLEIDGIHITRFGCHTVILRNITDLVIKNCSFTNTSVAPNWRSIMNLGGGVRDVVIDNCTFFDSSNFCINAIGDRYGTSEKSYHLLISDSHFEHTYNHGAIQLCDYASHMTVAGNTFYDCYCGVDIYFHELETNPNRQSNHVIRSNTFTDIMYYPMFAMGTINSLFLDNTVNGSGYSAFGVTGYCNNVILKDNVVFDSYRIHDDYNTGHPNILVTYENNTYSGIESEIAYYVRCGGHLVVKDDFHQPGFQVEMLNTDIAGVTDIVYTDGRVFDYAMVSGSGYTITEPAWYPDKSCFAVSSPEGNPSIFEISPFNMTVIPDTDSLEVLMITWDTTGTCYKKWQEICESAAVTTSHTVGDFIPYSIVEVKINSVAYDTFAADSSGWIAFDYTGGFSQDTVTFEAEVISSAIEEVKIIQECCLSRNFPNPFHSSTRINYQLQVESGTEHVRLDIFDLSGRLVRNLVNAEQHTGFYQVIWQGDDAGNQSVPSGVYLFHFTAGSYNAEGKMILL